jgi:predicted acetyltransferase
MSESDHLTLVTPAAEFAAEYRAMVAEFRATAELPFNNFELAGEDFPAFVRELEDEAQGIGLPLTVVPQQTYWLVKDGMTLLGEIRLRPHLTEPFEQHNGHIGYNIRPSWRGQGYATRQLALVLQRAREQGLRRVMLTINGDNPASVRVIEKNRGTLEWRRVDPATGAVLACYWIELSELA